MNRLRTLAAASILLSVANNAAAEIEVTHWWTSGGEAAAVKEFAKAYNAVGGKWIDGAIAGSSANARPIIISRILGGNPMGATQLNHGRQAEELIEAGLLSDLTEVAEQERWRDIIYPPSLLDSCTYNGHVYCAPINIHSWHWLWLSHAAYKKAGVPVPTTWAEFVSAAPKLRDVGIVPLAMGDQGWQKAGAFDVITAAIAGVEVRNAVNAGDTNAARSPQFAAAFEAAVIARGLKAGSNVQDWNQATNMVITGMAGGQIMGDWAQGEFQQAGLVAGEDYSCLPGLGVNNLLDTGGDALYFPKAKDEKTRAAQIRLASVVVSKDAQVAFNLKKGSLPIRGDIELGGANSCMQKGLSILAEGGVMKSGDQTLAADTVVQLEDLMAEFWSTDMTASDAQTYFAQIIESSE